MRTANRFVLSPQRSSVWWVVLAYVALVAYASFYPFRPWQSNGMRWWEFLRQPWPHYWGWFDLVANVLGYMPVGFLVTLAALRDRGKHMPRRAVLMGVLGGSLFSLLVETLQNWLPLRVPSNVDWMLNSAGSLVGAVSARALGKSAAMDFWGHMRSRWLYADARLNILLVLLWPWALLYPQPLPFGLGQVQERLETWLGRQLTGTPFIEWVPLHAIEYQPLLDWQIALVVALGAWLPVLLLFDGLRSWRQRLPFALLLVAAGAGAYGLGTALAYGPQFAWDWLGRAAQNGLMLAGVLILVCAALPRWLNKLLLLLALLAQLVLVNGAGVSAYYGWEATWLPGRFIRFYGATQWLGWLWPYLVLVYLLVQLGSLLRRADQRADSHDLQ
ncbi:MAG: VanZ family protein [Brachymonas sp.]|nr:VanZ family protein [Brachymonas sp.]